MRHTEIFFDPQTHTQRGIRSRQSSAASPRADGAQQEPGLTSRIILSFLRDLPAGAAMATLDDALPCPGPHHRRRPRFSRAWQPRPRSSGPSSTGPIRRLLDRRHAGEEGPPKYIWQALDLLQVRRIDHGVHRIEDERLMERLVADQIPLTVCPLSNVKLRIFPSLEQHDVGRLSTGGAHVT